MSITETLRTVGARVHENFGEDVRTIEDDLGQLTLEVERPRYRELCGFLRDDPQCGFAQLMDLCGIDFLGYRAEASGEKRSGPRFAVVLHLLSITRNHRVRVRTFLDEETVMTDSVTDVWNSASWYEREAFDLYGIIFDGHPDLRRILTDYGFVGHPFRKDFPLSGNVEMRYDQRQRRVIYQPVTIEPRQLVPRVIREEGYGGRDS
jgi:NADH-quinone oxidoreductase subunit C